MALAERQFAHDERLRSQVLRDEQCGLWIRHDLGCVGICLAFLLIRDRFSTRSSRDLASAMLESLASLWPSAVTFLSGPEKSKTTTVFCFECMSASVSCAAAVSIGVCCAHARGATPSARSSRIIPGATRAPADPVR